MISKIQNDVNNYKIHLVYYNRARDAMFDAVKQLVGKGYKKIYIPGYIGWSPKEGSGIFDPINSINDLSRYYYRITRELKVDIDYLNSIITEQSILLVVNYFGFRDENIADIISLAKEKNVIVIEDNAHGFYTYFCNDRVGSDLTFFSLHKMLPFNMGGALLLENNGIPIVPNYGCIPSFEYNPFEYDIFGIARKRIANYLTLMELVKEKEDLFEPLKGVNLLSNNVPQTFPIVIKHGDRNHIYEIMNNAGYGVVSLYHTMIDELKNEVHKDALWLSSRIMNLPVHQDVDATEYVKMIELLSLSCK